MGQGNGILSAEGDFGRHLGRLAAGLAARGHRLDVIAHPGAAEAQIVGCENAIGTSLPPSFCRFLRESNGLSLSIDHDPRVSHDMIILGTDAIINAHREFADEYSDLDIDGDWRPEGRTSTTRSFWDGLVAFAFYGVGYCLFDTLAATNAEATVVDLDLEDLRDTRAHKLASSYREWFSKIAESAILKQ